MKHLGGLFNLIFSTKKRLVVPLSLAMLLAGLSEGVGLLTIVPIIALVQGDMANAGTIAHQLDKFSQYLGLSITLEGVLIFFILIVLLRSLILYVRDYLSIQLQNQVVDDLRQRCFSALLDVEWKWIVTKRKSDYINLISEDVSRVGLAVHFGLGLMVNLVNILLLIIITAGMSKGLMAITLAVCVLAFLFIFYRRNQTLRLGKSLSLASQDVQASIQESFWAMKLIKVTGNQSVHIERFLESIRKLHQQHLRFIRRMSGAQVLFQAVSAMGLASLFYFLIKVLNYQLPEILFLMLLLVRLINYLISANQIVHNSIYAMPALDEINHVIDDCLQNKESIEGASSSFVDLKEEMRLNDVTVSYMDRRNPALSAVTFSIRAGTTTVIIGSSGSGKSTLADVLMGLIAPDNGCLLVDGLLIDAATRVAWRGSVAYVPQDNFIFNESIRNNLLLGRDSISECELTEAIKLASADFVFDLPQGLDTRIGDGGVLLSGGERQRVALARAFLMKPKLLILDEATSALDIKTEKSIYQAIEKLHGSLTIVIISHRLDRIAGVDQVIMLDRGHLAWKGAATEIDQCPIMAI